MNLKKILSFALLLSTFGVSSCLEDNPDYAGGVLSPIANIQDLRRLYQDGDVTLDRQKLSGAYQLVGVVVSDATGGNVPGGEHALVVQNKRRGTIRGMIIPLPAAGSTPYAVGDSVVVNIEGGRLSKSSGSLRIEGLTPGSVTKVSSGRTPIIRETTIAALLASPDDYEGTLVRVTGAGLSPLPISGATYAGDKVLADGANNQVGLHTEAAASFATRRVPASATFVGIAVGSTGTPPVQLWLRTAADAIDPSGPVYAGFPESFEGVPQTTKPSYDMTAIDNTVAFGTGRWKLYQAILGNTSGRDRYTGTQGIRLQQNLSVPALVEMQFDVPNGASKVTLIYGAYYTDAASSWKLEYSQDQGATWRQTGPTVTDAGNWQRSITFLMNLQGPVRFRINKLGLGTSSPPAVLNGRLGLDDIAIYEN